MTLMMPFKAQQYYMKEIKAKYEHKGKAYRETKWSSFNEVFGL